MKGNEVFIPVNQRLIVKPLVETVTESGIIIPDGKEDKPYIGIILSEGASGIYSNGEKICFNKHTALQFDKFPDILIVKEEDVYFKIKQ